jgi:high-affinity iron transporter
MNHQHCPANEHLRIFSAWLRLAVAALVACLCSLAFAAGPSAEEKAQTAIHMLDYVGVDYPEVVQDGKVLNAAEYEEQREFATQAIALLEQLPPVAGQPALVGKARQVLARIEGKAPGAEVAALANEVGAEVVRVYRLTVAPRHAPDLRKAAALYQAQCVACHGAEGRGDGPAARGMEPPPSNFHDDARMKQRSLYGLYNTITLGVAGTPMRPHTELSEADRWSLSFLVGSMRVAPATVQQGKSLWSQGKGKEQLGNFRALVTVTPADVLKRDGAELDAVRAYLTAEPAAIESAGPPPLELTRTKLGEALAAYRQGDKQSARQLAITAYLEGFELVEASLDNVDPTLRANTEREMMALRSAIDSGQAVDRVSEQVGRINWMLDRAQEKLGTDSMSDAAAFTTSLLILLREGLEAILVLAAIVAFVVKTGRRDALPYIHAGWIAALLMGGLTWVAATHLLEISGASRELTEGIAALLAAAMLLYVGSWLHRKSSARAWQSFIRDKVTGALGKRTLWAMAGVSFLAIYRELFEIILFYQTLWLQAGAERHAAVLGGIALAAILLAAMAWIILRYSVRLPIGPFFAATSGLLVLLAFVFVGDGVAALQEAGVLAFTPTRFIDFPLLGIRPSLQGLAAQLAVVAGVGLALFAARRRSRVA